MKAATLLLSLAAVALLSVPAHAQIDFAQSSDFGADLANIPFEQIIGGPLIAAVDAQQAAAEATEMFITSIGFTQQIRPSSPGVFAIDKATVKTVQMVEFNYFQSQPNGSTLQRSMQVPFLYLVPIPYLQLDSITIDFSVLLTSVAEKNATISQPNPSMRYTGSSYFKFGSQGCWLCYGGMYGSVSETSSSESSTKITKTYSLVINVRASQAALPEGMARMLDIFETLISSDLDPITP